MISKEFLLDYTQKARAALYNTDLEKIQTAALMIRQASRVFLCGNGGSASLADHMATDLQLAGVQAIALTNVAALTTYANDHSYVRALQLQLEAFKPTAGDVLIAISTSGNSSNVVAAVSYAGVFGVDVIAMTGNDGGQLALRASVTCQLHVDSTHTGVIQDTQQAILHMIAYGLMEEKK